MALNAWECGGCGRKVVGSGGGYGLRAIGWYIEYGGGRQGIRCPDCRPDKVPCMDNQVNWGKPCAICRAEIEAKEYQLRMGFLKYCAARDEYGPERDAKVHGDTFYASNEAKNRPLEAVTEPKPPSTKDLG